ncbi:hypothetical protein ABS767_03475 [Sphingomonas sp. ST-64]|uniref:YcxB-like protein n=1 Tax=Sphingomonas plantiphila TaxID=3163295 RepID=A0ABW8YIC5_9SPHN
MMQSDVHHFSATEIGPLQRLLHKSEQPSPRAVGALLVLAGALGIAAYLSEEVWEVAALPAAAIAITIVAWLTPGSSSRTLKDWVDRHAACASTVAWDETGVRTGGCAHGLDTVFPWASIRTVIASADYIILLSRCGPLIVPHRALDAERSADLLRQVEKNRITVRHAD